MNKSNSPIQLLRILYGALFLSLFLHLFNAFMVSRGNAFDIAEARPDFSDSFELILSVVAVVVAAIAIVIPNILWRINGRKLQKSPDGTPPELKTLMAKFFVPWILRMAFFASVTILGFVIASQKHSPAKIVPYLVVSIIGYLLNFPTEDRIRQTF